MRAEEFARFCIKHRFDKAFGLTQRNGFPITNKREIANFDLVARFLRFRFGQPNARDLGMAISATRNVEHIHRVRVVTCNGFGCDHTFM